MSLPWKEGWGKLNEKGLQKHLRRRKGRVEGDHGKCQGSQLVKSPRSMPLSVAH